MIDAPETTLVVDDAYFTFDRDSLKVDSGLLQGDGLDATRLEASRRKRLDWLWQWAFWLDQSVEPLMQVPDDLTANMLLRALFDYSASDQDQRQAWVGIGAMPLLPRWASFVARLGWVPRKFRAPQGKKIHAYRQKMAHWLDGEVERWEGVREQDAMGEQTERPFEAYMGHLRRQIEAGSFTVEVLSAFKALLGSISPLIEILEIKGSDREDLVLMLKVHNENGDFSATRHHPTQALDQLIGMHGQAVADQRVREIGFRIAILLSEMLQIMHCRRNQVAMAFVMSHHGASKPVFALTFKATLFLTYRTPILASIGRRRIPDLPICKTLKLDDFR
ncbi:hypothetical protein [uncultured Cohaesibacter sp.]|uniref:hypothetical protein n=1 Tax=uncultured Cohaesibacter sp. TaxID=1002546 RepID=UPI0029C791EE|nr:hypothetical protein [uncultured Cohaesibacter sp.]